MRFPVRLLAFAFVIALGSTLLAQRAMVSPIPAWPPDNNVPDSLKNNYVFVGPRVGELTISYPANLEDSRQTGRRIFTVESHSLVEPTFSTEVVRNANGDFVYWYTLRNAVAAKHPIRFWSLLTPASDLAANRMGWGALQIPVRPDRQPGTWFFSDERNEVQPGGSLDRFQVTSKYSPGFTTAYVQSGVGWEFPIELPAPVADQVGALMNSMLDGKVVTVIGPKLPSGMSAQGIAAEFHVGISQLVQAHRLDADSPFVRQILPSLRTIIEAGPGSTLKSLLTSLPKPLSGLESEIAAALQLSGN